MQAISKPLWTPENYCLSARSRLAATVAQDLADTVYTRVFRTDFDAPGFCLISLEAATDSHELRQIMVALKFELQRIHRLRTTRDLLYISAGRFDQQVTTKAHRDGAPDESILMLGYEPSVIASEVTLSDYSRCAFDSGITPRDFLDKHNPMFKSGQSLLEQYTTKVECFSNTNSQILLINNSDAPFDRASMQGVLHTAKVFVPDENQRRVINSTTIGVFEIGTPEPVSAIDLEQFLVTTAVKRQGNDKKYLKDDV
jgi:hypothetical protein